MIQYYQYTHIHIDIIAPLAQAAESVSGAFAASEQVAAKHTAFSAAVKSLEHAPIVVGLDAYCILIAAIIGYIGVSVMTYGVLRSIWDFVMATGKNEHRLPMIRVNLGKHLALGLEFLVGKDIVESIVHPTWDDLGKLGAIIALRTIVTVFLSRELKEVEEELQLEEKELNLEERRQHLEKKPA